MICAQLCHTFCKYRVYFRKSKSFGLNIRHSPVFPPQRPRTTGESHYRWANPPDPLRRNAPSIVIPGLTRNLVFRPGFPGKTCQVPLNKGGPSRKTGFFLPGASGRVGFPGLPSPRGVGSFVPFGPTKRPARDELPPAFCNAPARQAPTAQANGHRPPHILPTGCRKASADRCPQKRSLVQ